MFRRIRLLALLVLPALVLVSGCRVETEVRVVVDADGSGRVVLTGTFDREAADRLGADPAAALRLDDLEAAGWSIDGPTVDDAGMVVEASKPFASTDRLGAVMEELGGDSGPFVGWELSTENSFTSSEYRLTGSVDLTGSLDQFSDDGVAGALDGFATGRSPEELAEELAAHPEGIRLTVAAALPGEVDEATGLDRGEGDAEPSRSFVVGDGTAVANDVSVLSTASDRTPVLWILLGLGLVAASVALFAASARQRARRRRVTARGGRVRGA